MLYLLFATLSSSAIALCFKYSESQKLNRYVVTSINYFASVIISAIMMTAAMWQQLRAVDFASFNRELFPVLIGRAHFTPQANLGWAIAFGMITGAIFLASFLFYQNSVKINGAALSGAFARMGILIGMTGSIILWRELPASLQWIGIGLALAAIVIANLSPDNIKLWKFNLSLFLIWIAMGSADFALKIFEKYSLQDSAPAYMLVVFITAFIFSVTFIRRPKRISGREWLVGLLVGTFNIASTYFLILAFTHLNTSVVYSIFSAGCILIISLGATAIFHERLQRKDLIAIALVLIALVLVNVK